MSDCIVHLALVCLFDPSNVVVSNESSWMVSGDFQYIELGDKPYTGALNEFSVMVDVPISRRFSVQWGGEHRSYLSGNDRGYEALKISFTWRPFR